MRSGRAAHEATLAGLEGRPGARHLYGEVRCDAIEGSCSGRRSSRRGRRSSSASTGAASTTRTRWSRRLYARLERILRPVVDAEERRAGARLVRAGRETAAPDEVGLRALNEALRAAFDAPGQTGFPRGGAAAGSRRSKKVSDATPFRPSRPRRAPSTLDTAMQFKHSLVRLHPGEQRGVSLLFDPARVPPGSRSRPPPTLGSSSCSAAVTSRNRWRAAGRASAVPSRALVSAEPGSRLSVFAEAGGHDAELVVFVVRHHASGWVREIARKD